MKGVRLINEYSYLKYFWDSFGISPEDIDKYDPDWLRKMAICGSQDNRAQAARIKANQ